jgi:hypothetical protein
VVFRKLDVVAAVAKRVLQLVGGSASDLPEIVPIMLNDADHFIHISPGEGGHCNRPTEKPPL